MRRYWFRVLLCLAIVFALAAPLASAEQHDGPRAYLVGLKPGKKAKDLEGAGVRVHQEWAHLEAAHVVADNRGLARLRGHPSVAYVEEDRVVRAFTHGGGDVDNGEITWGLGAIHASDAWASGARGAGIRVCVLDTGIDYDHPEFLRGGVSIVKGSKNFVADGHADARDGHGHGTHVAGTIAAQLNEAGVGGAAPDVDLYVARVLGDDGRGSTSGIINVVNWCVDTARTHVANLSLGSSFSSRTEQRAFDSAYNKGMFSIAASGNDGANRISYPANYNSVVAVGAVDARLALASFSNYGKNQELVGPGVAVRSSVPRGTGRVGVAGEDGVSYKNNPLEFSGVGSTSGPLVECGLADTTNSCANRPATGAWIALINRGAISFADKVNNVTSQGATAAIVANNDTAAPDDAGSFTLGAAGTWIPTVSVSYNSGVAIRAGGLGQGSLTVDPSDYAYYDGTSMASPHVAAVAALAWSAKPTLTNAKVRTVLQQTAKDLGAAGKDTRFGYGLVQAASAVERARITN